MINIIRRQPNEPPSEPLGDLGEPLRLELVVNRPRGEDGALAMQVGAHERRAPADAVECHGCWSGRRDGVVVGHVPTEGFEFG